MKKYVWKIWWQNCQEISQAIRSVVLLGEEAFFLLWTYDGEEKDDEDDMPVMQERTRLMRRW